MPVNSQVRVSFNPYLSQVVSQGGNLAPLVLALMQSETRNLNPRAISRVGAKGLLQLMPVVYESAGINPFNPRDNIRVGINHIRRIQGVLRDIDPTRFPPPGVLPHGFARKVTIGGWVRGYSKEAGIGKLMNEYQGKNWNDFLTMFPSWKKQDNWISKVAERTDTWKGELRDTTPIIRVAGKGLGGGGLVVMLVLFLAAYAFKR